ncbi:MAG: branched-chain amino acid ABC transporter permease [Microthrixaceae bacterium]
MQPEPSHRGDMDLDQALNLVVAGLATGSIYALLAMGYNVVFATTGILNFAQGELFMVGSLVGASLFVASGWPILAAVVIAVGLAAILGAVEEPLAVRPATKRGHSAFGWVLSTFGFAIVLRSGAALIFGPDLRPFPPLFGRGQWNLGGVFINPTEVSLLVLTLLVAFALHSFYTRSLMGRALAAIAQDPEAASFRGLPVGRLSIISFAIGSALAALAGFVAGPLTGTYPAIGLGFALKGFIAAAVGGIPEIKGALVGGLGLGLIEAFGADIIGPGYRDAIVFAVLLIMLGVKPAGIFGRESVRAV